MAKGTQTRKRHSGAKPGAGRPAVEEGIVTVTGRIAVELEAKLAQLALEAGITRSDAVAEAIRRYVMAAEKKRRRFGA